jgi:hypothetical protein
VVERSGRARIEVSSPHVLMQVSSTKLRNNAREGFAIRNSRHLSPTGFVGGCWRVPTEVDLPLAPLSFVRGNELVGNGAAANGIQLFSDHRVGTLPVDDDFWGTIDSSIAADRVRCPGVCTINPIRTVGLGP